MGQDRRGGARAAPSIAKTTARIELTKLTAHYAKAFLARASERDKHPYLLVFVGTTFASVI
jgi:hypothetical protein